NTSRRGFHVSVARTPRPNARRSRIGGTGPRRTTAYSTVSSSMSDSDISPQLRPEAYLRVMRRRKWPIAAVAIITAALALGVSLMQPKVYEASTSLVLSDAPVNNQYPIFQPERVALTEAAFIESDVVHARVQRGQKRNVPRASASVTKS